MKILKTDLFTSPAEAIGHGVNCIGSMGAGIAKPMGQRYPEMYQEYKKLCHTGELVPGGVFAYHDHWDGYIYNIASQYRPGPDARLDWLEQGLEKMMRHAEEVGVNSIGLPQIGCGYGGLAWEDVLAVLNRVQDRHVGVELIIHIYKP